MKKILSLVLALIFCFSLGTLAFAAEEDIMLISENPNAGISVTVTVSDAGTLRLVSKNVDVTDVDNDGALTINDAIILAHSAYYPDGANGYASYPGDYGLAISKLWGVENGGSYMYYLNDIMPLSLTEPVKNGDRITVYSFADLEGWSDVYTFFDKTAAEVKVGDKLEFTLKGYDWSLDPNGGASPISGATIYLNGNSSNIITDSEGKATVTFNQAGIYVISAKSTTATLTPPTCVVKVGFTDVKESDDFSSAVNYMLTNGMLAGFDGSTFEPYGEASRAMLIDALHIGEGSPSAPADFDVNFTDINSHLESFRWAAYNGIVEGFGNGKAGPLSKLTREQMAAIIWRFASSKGVDISVGSDTNILSYNDASAVSEWAVSAVQWACGSGLIAGDADGNLRPSAYVSRSELAQCIYMI